MTGHRSWRWWMSRSAIAAAAVVVVTTAGVVVADVADRDPGLAPATIVRPSGRPMELSWDRAPWPVGAMSVSSIAGGPDGLVAVGSVAGPPDGPRTPAIWYSTDGSDWAPTFTEEPVLETPDPTLPPTYRSLSLGHAYAVDGRFVVTGYRNIPMEGQRAVVLVSSGGRTWTRADEPFDPPTDAVSRDREFGGPGSSVADVVEWRGRILAIGEVYTDSDAPAGLTAAVWTSDDGLDWRRRLVDLGDGYDPYFWSVVTHGRSVVAGGRMGKWPAVVWTSRDLRRWDAADLTDGDGSSTITAFGDGYVASGTVTVGSRRHLRGQPTIWWSRDAEHWEVVVALDRTRAAKDPDGYWFRGAVTADDVAIVSGPQQGAGARGAGLLASRDGHTWSRVTKAPSGDLTPIGADGDGIYVVGTSLWRVTRR